MIVTLLPSISSVEGQILNTIPEQVRSHYRVVSFKNRSYKVYFGGELVALVKVLENRSLLYMFLDGTLGQEFKETMERKHFPKKEDNDLLWLVLLSVPPVYWSIVGKPEKSDEEALKWVNENTLDRLAVLISYYPNRRGEESLVAESISFLEGMWPNVSKLDDNQKKKLFYLYE